MNDQIVEAASAARKLKTALFDSARGVVRLVILGETPDMYYVCSPDEYVAAKRERRRPLQVGFRKTDLVEEP